MNGHPAYNLPRYMRGRRAVDIANKLEGQAAELHQWGEREMSAAHMKTLDEAKALAAERERA